MEKEYHNGEIVFLKADSSEKMIVRWSEGQTYFCQMLSNPEQAEVGYEASGIQAIKLPNPHD